MSVTGYDKNSSPGGKARSHEAGAGTASRPMTGLNAGSIPAPRVTSVEERLPAELKAKWVEALRSGRYPQGTGYLLSSGRYCCLGVLAEVAGAKPESIQGHGVLSSVSPSLSRMLDPLEVERKVGVTLENMNDGHGSTRKHSFSEIADWIEANL